MRVSTAGAGTSGYLGRLTNEMPAGLILNVGAGAGDRSEGPQVLVHVDHVLPAEHRLSGLRVVADAHDLPFTADAFAGAVAKDVLEHVQDPLRVLNELSRTSRTGARLLVVVPRAIPRAVWDDPTHVRGFTERALRTALQLTGWRTSTAIRRLGGFPGAGRLGLGRHLEMLMRVPGLGHWFGRNWIARATLGPTRDRC